MTETEKAKLSERQTQVLRLAGDGLTMPEIAQELGISKVTVKLHLRETRLKLGIPNKRGLVVAAREYFKEA